MSLAVISPIAGTRIEPPDGYVFMRGTTATFKVIFTMSDNPTTVDANTFPVAQIFAPQFLGPSEIFNPVILATINGNLVPGQQFEYQFVWDIPNTVVPLDDYIISYYATVNGLYNNYGDEYFTINGTSGPVGIRRTGFCTVNDIRQKKFNIDDYLPKALAADVRGRDSLIYAHIVDASNRLREELNLAKMRQVTENFRLFTIYYTIWSILLAARGEDGSSVSDSNIQYWRTEWSNILAQEKRESVLQGIPMGRG
jgi:hypothetical protein